MINCHRGSHCHVQIFLSEPFPTRLGKVKTLLYATIDLLVLKISAARNGTKIFMVAVCPWSNGQDI
jgi:hypothetical protein